jgi:hypothetical protein
MPIARHVVRLSGQTNETLARPFASVTTDGDQNAVSRKLPLTCGAFSSRDGPPE